MWRAFFLAIGIWFCILGIECLVVDKAVLADAVSTPAPLLAADGTFTPPGSRSEIDTREWMPWSFLTVGMVVILYSITIPKRIGG